MRKELRDTILGLSESVTGPNEVADGVFETRRRLLWMPIAAAATLLLRQTAVFPQVSTQVVNTAWNQFLKECLPTAEELHADGSAAGQDRYLRWLGYSASRLKLGDLPAAKLGKFKNLEPASYFGVGYRGKPFFVVEWRLEPSAFLPPHNHPNVSVCTIGLEGEARLRNFEPVGETPGFESSMTFRVRETSNEIIRPGVVNMLSAVRNNIHTFTAGKSGARGIDITTYHGDNIGFSHLNIGETSMDPTDRVFEASWKKL